MIQPYYHENGITIFNANCVSVMSQMCENTIDVVWTDPPYGNANHDGDLNSALNEHRKIADKPIANDSEADMKTVVDQMLIEAARVCKKDCAVSLCCSGGGGPNGPMFAWLANRMDEKGLQFFHSVIWDKLNPGLGWRFRRQHEMIMVSHRKGGKLRWNKNEVAVPNIIKAFPPRVRQHPNEKPLALVTPFLEWLCKPGDVVIDPFMGSGTTLVAAKSLGLTAIGCELDEAHCRTAVERLSQNYLPITSPVVMSEGVLAI